MPLPPLISSSRARALVGQGELALAAAESSAPCRGRRESLSWFETKPSGCVVTVSSMRSRVVSRAGRRIEAGVLAAVDLEGQADVLAGLEARPVAVGRERQRDAARRLVARSSDLGAHLATRPEWVDQRGVALDRAGRDKALRQTATRATCDRASMGWTGVRPTGTPIDMI